MGTPAGWYDDGSGRQRWWDGATWTSYYADARITPDRKRQLVSFAVADAVSKGGRVEFQTDENAVIVYGRRANHILHLILTLVTFGLWVLVWIIVALASGERRSTVRVDDYGHVLWQ